MWINHLKVAALFEFAAGLAGAYRKVTRPIPLAAFSLQRVVVILIIPVCLPLPARRIACRHSDVPKPHPANRRGAVAAGTGKAGVTSAHHAALTERGCEPCPLPG